MSASAPTSTYCTTTEMDLYCGCPPGIRHACYIVRQFGEVVHTATVVGSCALNPPIFDPQIAFLKKPLPDSAWLWLVCGVSGENCVYARWQSPIFGPPQPMIPKAPAALPKPTFSGTALFLFDVADSVEPKDVEPLPYYASHAPEPQRRRGKAHMTPGISTACRDSEPLANYSGILKSTEADTAEPKGGHRVFGTALVKKTPSGLDVLTNHIAGGQTPGPAWKPLNPGGVFPPGKLSIQTVPKRFNINFSTSSTVQQPPVFGQYGGGPFGVALKEVRKEGPH